MSDRSLRLGRQRIFIVPDLDLVLMTRQPSMASQGRPCALDILTNIVIRAVRDAH